MPTIEEYITKVNNKALNKNRRERRDRMTLRQQRLSKEILNPENKTLKEAGEKAGYKTDKARTIYRDSTKKHILEALEAQGINKESLGKAYNGLIELCLKKQDYSTAKSSLDSIAKMYNCLKDNNIEIKQGVFSEDIMAKVRARLSSNPLTESPKAQEVT